MNKGVVMERTADSIIVLTTSGAFERIPAQDRSCQVGEEIVFSSAPAVRFRQPAFLAISTLAAAVVLCMMLFSAIPAAFADKTVVAYVSLDINPSLELGLDKKEKVRELRGLNDKGEQIAESISYKGKPLEDVAVKVLQKADELKLLDSGDANIVIAGSAAKEDAPLKDETVTEELKLQVLTYVAMKHPNAKDIEVTAFTAPPEVRESAQQNGLSTGKYSVYLGAKNEGHDVKVEDLKQDSIHTLVKEAGGLDKLVDVNALKKDTIKAMMQEEKSGSLDKKVQEKKKEEERRAATSKPSPGKSGTAPGKTGATPASPSAKPATANAAQPSGKAGAASPSPSGSKKDDNKDDKKDDKNSDKDKSEDKKSTPAASPAAKPEASRSARPSPASDAKRTPAAPTPTSLNKDKQEDKEQEDVKKEEKKDEKNEQDDDSRKDNRED